MDTVRWDIGPLSNLFEIFLGQRLFSDRITLLGLEKDLFLHQFIYYLGHNDRDSSTPYCAERMFDHYCLFDSRILSPFE